MQYGGRLSFVGVWVLVLAGCGSAAHTTGFGSPDASNVDGGRSDAQMLGGDSAGIPGDAGAPMTCQANSTDLANCTCTSAGGSRACYPANADPATRNVGTCKDGMQTCVQHGEFATWGPCTGAVTPAPETCTSTVDSNCNGKTGCADPSCATDPTCMTGCTSGQTRACYTGPAGTENVGTCKDGTQTCANSMWPTDCPGEVLPTPENCTDALDHNCNYLPGCLDIFACLTSPACQQTCVQAMLDPGCVCPQGAGDTATCPDGDHGVTKGGSLTNPGMLECCPCTANDCSDPGCCGETVCTGNSQCAGLTCKPLAASCNGQVNADCDDFPEDCDEPCCKCTNCP